MLRWCKESTIHHLWWFIKSLLDHICAAPKISRLHRLMFIYSQLFGYTCDRHFCVTLSSKNTLYNHVGNFDTVFVLPTDAKFHKFWTFGHIWKLQATRGSFYQSIMSFIIVDVFLLLLAKSVYPRIYDAFWHQIYTIQFLQKFLKNLQFFQNLSTFLIFFFFFLALATRWAICQTVRNYKEWMILRRDRKWITRWL